MLGLGYKWRKPSAVVDNKTRALACGLGLFSIGLGVAEILWPDKLSKALGMKKEQNMFRLFGLREVANGAAILASSNPRPWIAMRMAGDIVDIAVLAKGLNSRNSKKRTVAAALAAVGGVTVLDFICMKKLMKKEKQPAAYHDYSDRSGFPAPKNKMRGLARNFKIPDDMRTPELLRPWPATSIGPARTMH